MKQLMLILLFIGTPVFSLNLLIKNVSFEEELYAWDYGVIGNTRLDRPIALFSTNKSPRTGKLALSIDIEKSFTRSGGKNIYLIQGRI